MEIYRPGLWDKEIMALSDKEIVAKILKRKVRNTAIVIVALGTFSNNQQKYLENPLIGLSTLKLQKSVLLEVFGNSPRNPRTPVECVLLLPADRGYF